MSGPGDGARAASGEDDAQSRAVSLDELFGGVPTGGAGDGADGGPAGGSADGPAEGASGADAAPAGGADGEPGGWADVTAEPEPEAPPRAMTLGELTGERDPGTDEPAPRAVSFDGAPATDEPAFRAVSFDGAPDRRATARSGARRGAKGAAGAGTGAARAGSRADTPAGTGAARRRGARVPENETPAEQETRAKDICLRLLTDRARTVKELGDALRRKEIPDEVAHRVLGRFDEVGLLDDKAFADQWVRSRHRHRGLGKRAIALELHRKGVDRETADEALTEIDDDSERERARELVARRLRTLPIGSRDERQSTARKLVGMLARKGYGPGVAYGVVKEEIAAAGADVDELGETPPED